MKDPVQALRELEQSGAMTPEEVRDALLRAMRRLDRAGLERLARSFEATGRHDHAKRCRAMAEGKPQIH